MKEGKNSHVSLAKSVQASLTFGNDSLYTKLLELVGAPVYACNSWDEYSWRMLETKFDPCVAVVLLAVLQINP